MSLYNELFGIDTLAPVLLNILGLDLKEIPRLRDCCLSEDQNEIIVYTRTGGGNRECHCEKPHEDGCYADMNEQLRKHPGFVTDYDDDFDKTYAYWVFKIPEEGKAFLKEFIEGSKITIKPPRQIGQKFKDMVADLEAGKETPQTIKGRQVAEDMFKKMGII